MRAELDWIRMADRDIATSVASPSNRTVFEHRRFLFTTYQEALVDSTHRED